MLRNENLWTVFSCNAWGNRQRFILKMVGTKLSQGANWTNDMRCTRTSVKDKLYK